MKPIKLWICNTCQLPCFGAAETQQGTEAPTTCIRDNERSHCNWKIYDVDPIHSISSIPNCVTCKWYRLDNSESNFPYDICVAQGGKDTDEVYGNDICKALYEEKQ